MGDRGSVTAVCLAAAAAPPGGRGELSGIDKRPVPGPVHVGMLGLDGDHVVDARFHGGNDQALYAYSDAEADEWVAELGREVPPGWFGENLRVRGVATSDAVIGEQWRLGEPGTGPVVEVTTPRTPCGKFARHTGESRWVTRFTSKAHVGTYLRVVSPGLVGAGDPVTVLRRPAHGVTIRNWFTDAGPEPARILLAAEREGQLRLQESLRRQAAQVLAGASA